jgi:hypothetical protein
VAALGKYTHADLIDDQQLVISIEGTLTIFEVILTLWPDELQDCVNTALIID